uniref:HELICc2 domain-containing protein n=1 Tax=Panagrellus redivivus TaxID=6233 RepID=A0A7E4VTF4_PANRE
PPVPHDALNNPAVPHAALANPAAPHAAPPIAIRQINIAQNGYQQAPPPQHPQPAAINENPATVPVKLPALALPRFSDGVEEFHVFWNRFEVAVHRKNIATVDKLLHLKSCLHGEAGRAVANFPDTEDNYIAVVDTLNRKYGDKEILSLTL